MKKTVITVVTIIVLVITFISYFTLLHEKNNEIPVIKFSSWGSQSETEIIKSAISDFEAKNPDVKIDFVHIPQNYFQKIHLLFASGLEPDVVFFNNQNIPLYIKAGLLEDLSPYFKEEENLFFDEAINCFKNENGLYAIPRDISNLVIYYNKDTAKNLKVHFPKKINNIYELGELAKRLTSNNTFGLNFESNSLFWLYYLASDGGGILSDDGKSIIINSKESIEALNLYADMINKYHCMPSKAEIGSLTTAQMFINGKLAMYLGGRWMVPKFRETINFDWDIIEFPANEQNKVYVDASGWAVAKHSKHKDEAVRFIKYMSSGETLNKLAQTGLIIPARKESAYSNNFLEPDKKPKNNEAFINMLKYAKPTPVNENYSYINDIINEKTENLFGGKERAENLFDEKTMAKLERLL